ncbi:MAG: nitrate- and nitrite sensing domain-containing protein [Gammaproteobacteria bacterium]|nr:nitrate- and nitrite sensing domain-containing protein [Gammaproteobacteria bacterium]
MEFTLLFFIGVSLLPVMGLVRYIHNKKHQSDGLKAGLALLDQIQKLVLSCQQHRGLSNAVLQGDSNLKQQLLSVQQTIDALIYDGNKMGLKQFAQWLSFADHWPRLKMHTLSRDLPSQNLVRQHNVMIEGHLSLMDEIVRFYSLHTIMLDQVTRMSGLCLDTLRVAETVGQTRAIGSGVCARGECSGVDKISLNFLRISLMTTTESLFKELSSVENKELHVQFNTASHTVKRSVEHLLRALDDFVLVEGNTKIDSNEYFKIATKPIEELFSVYTMLLNYGQKVA